MSIKPGSEFVEVSPDRAHRTLRVLAVAGYQEGMKQPYAFCATRGKATVISIARLTNTSRFVPREEYAEAVR